MRKVGGEAGMGLLGRVRWEAGVGLLGRVRWEACRTKQVRIYCHLSSLSLSQGQGK
jgi:hypothetical protein